MHSFPAVEENLFAMIINKQKHESCECPTVSKVAMAFSQTHMNLSGGDHEHSLWTSSGGSDKDSWRVSKHSTKVLGVEYTHVHKIQGGKVQEISAHDRAAVEKRIAAMPWPSDARLRDAGFVDDQGIPDVTMWIRTVEQALGMHHKHTVTRIDKIPSATPHQRGCAHGHGSDTCQSHTQTQTQTHAQERAAVNTNVDVPEKQKTRKWSAQVIDNKVMTPLRDIFPDVSRDLWVYAVITIVLLLIVK